ncbi:hypothetical protein HDU93_007323, partial [Gonapodya sp. JEL0774]
MASHGVIDAAAIPNVSQQAVDRSVSSPAVLSSPPRQSRSTLYRRNGFHAFLKAAKWADVLLKIKTTDGKMTSVPAHRVILGWRSSFFEGLFNAPPKEVSSKGLPVFQLPVLPPHRSLHEVVGKILWALYTLDEALPEPQPLFPSPTGSESSRKWDEVVGVMKVALLLDLPEYATEARNIIDDALGDSETESTDQPETSSAKPDDVQKGKGRDDSQDQTAPKAEASSPEGQSGTMKATELVEANMEVVTATPASAQSRNIKASPSDLFLIALESRAWELPELTRRVSKRLASLLASPAVTDPLLVSTPPEAVSLALPSIPETRRFAFVRRYLDARRTSAIPLSPETCTALWNLVPFHAAPLADLESGFEDPEVPVSDVLDAVCMIASLDPSDMSNASLDLVTSVLEHGVHSGLLSPQTQYEMVKAWSMANTEMAGLPATESMWRTVQFKRFEIQHLEIASRERVAPSDIMMEAMLELLKTSHTRQATGRTREVPKRAVQLQRKVVQVPHGAFDAFESAESSLISTHAPIIMPNGGRPNGNSTPGAVPGAMTLKEFLSTSPPRAPTMLDRTPSYADFSTPSPIPTRDSTMTNGSDEVPRSSEAPSMLSPAAESGFGSLKRGATGAPVVAKSPGRPTTNPLVGFGGGFPEDGHSGEGKKSNRRFDMNYTKKHSRTSAEDDYRVRSQSPSPER